MMRVLLTAFEPYDVWNANASWLTLVELTRALPTAPKVTTRLYPVELEAVRRRLSEDMTQGFDYIILTGQAPGRTRIELETVALNLAAQSRNEELVALVEEGPTAYASSLPARQLCQRIRAAGIPAAVSCHAGTFLCNASLYLALHTIETQRLATQAIFVHLPLDPSQAVEIADPIASMPAAISARALSTILDQLNQLTPPARDIV